MADIKDFPIGSVTEDDSREIPEWIKNMSLEELKAEEERLFAEMKANPQKREKIKLPFKTILDDLT
ncbi:hypothetical protein [Butyrivibrio sp. WCD3002]|uniref:hypothetical protein n=1 Tax=Butyrivibrio sp. WCD3002 TaxID=1280676 RepID=UPI0004251012|nr:hypothetical protein [Butyrivibrio sp. WCD3002]